MRYPSEGALAAQRYFFWLPEKAKEGGHEKASCGRLVTQGATDSPKEF